MSEELDRLTRNGSVSQEAYRAMRDAIQRTLDQRGRLFERGQEAHYVALAVAMALRELGYSIEKLNADA